MESKKTELVKLESRMLVTRGWGIGKLERFVLGYKLKTNRLKRPGDLMHSIVTIINNTVIYETSKSC